MPHTHAFAINPPICHLPAYLLQFPVENDFIKTSGQTLQSGIYCGCFWASCRLYNAVACCVTINHSCSVCVFSIVASWEVNAIGHPVVLLPNVCEELLQVIDKSNSTLPASMRCMRSYEVSQLLCAPTDDNWDVEILWIATFFSMCQILGPILCNKSTESLIYLCCAWKAVFATRRRHFQLSAGTYSAHFLLTAPCLSIIQ